MFLFEVFAPTCTQMRPPKKNGGEKIAGGGGGVSLHGLGSER